MLLLGVRCVWGVCGFFGVQYVGVGVQSGTLSFHVAGFFEAFDLPQWYHVFLLLVAVFKHFFDTSKPTYFTYQVGLEVSKSA